MHLQKSAVLSRLASYNQLLNSFLRSSITAFNVRRFANSYEESESNLRARSRAEALMVFVQLIFRSAVRVKRAFSLSVKVLHSWRAHSPFESRSRILRFAYFGFHFALCFFVYTTQVREGERRFFILFVSLFGEFSSVLQDLSTWIFVLVVHNCELLMDIELMISDCVNECGKICLPSSATVIYAHSFS